MAPNDDQTRSHLQRAQLQTEEDRSHVTKTQVSTGTQVRKATTGIHGGLDPSGLV